MNMVKVSPSILGVEKDKLSFVCQEFISSGADLIHFDVMDGTFVSNKSLVDDEISLVSNLVNNDIIDVHLMCKNLDYYIPIYIKKHVKYISIHYEAENIEDLIKHSKMIKDHHILPGIVINPETNVNLVLPLIKYFSLVLVMSVHPGKGGQKFIVDSLEKVKVLNNFKKENNLDFQIEVDGGINNENAQILKELGANILVSGSYIIKSNDYEKRIKSLK